MPAVGVATVVSYAVHTTRLPLCASCLPLLRILGDKVKSIKYQKLPIF